jgi:hypothetical protein
MVYARMSHKHVTRVIGYACMHVHPCAGVRVRVHIHVHVCMRVCVHVHVVIAVAYTCVHGKECVMHDMCVHVDHAALSCRALSVSMTVS